MIKFKPILLEILNEASIEQLQQQFVDTGKISPDDFETIRQASSNKGSYATWLTSRVLSKALKLEDVYKFQEYFKIFEKYKNRYPQKDINQYKTSNDIVRFVRITTDIMDAEEASLGSIDDRDSLVSLKGIEELKSAGIIFLGIVEGYQCFKIPKRLSGDVNAYTIYRKWLAKCSTRNSSDEEERNIHICTMASQSYFDKYTKCDDLYVFFNLKDPKSPYQFFYNPNGVDGQSPQFMDKNDAALI